MFIHLFQHILLRLLLRLLIIPGGITGTGPGMLLIRNMQGRSEKKGDRPVPLFYIHVRFLIWSFREKFYTPIAQVGKQNMLGQPAGQSYQQEFPWRVSEHPGGQSGDIE